jgi:hypothetical protein
MANSFFKVQHGLQVGALSIDADTGDVVTTGNISLPTTPTSETSATSKLYVDALNVVFGN